MVVKITVVELKLKQLQTQHQGRKETNDTHLYTARNEYHKIQNEQ